MELLTITLAANETKQFAKAGRYFEIIDSIYAVRVDFVGDQGQQTDSMVNALSGLFIEDPFAAFAITNGATAQAVYVLLMETGRGGSRRQPGIVSITNRISAGITQSEGFGGALLLTGFSAIQVIAPAANVRGVTMRRCQVAVTTPAAAGGEIRLIFAPTVPVSTVPANAYAVAQSTVGASTSAVDLHVDLNYQMPAGWGLWVITNHTGSAASGASYSIAFEPVS